MVSRKIIALASAAVVLASVPAIEHTLADNVDSSSSISRESIVSPLSTVSVAEDAAVSFEYLAPPTNVIAAAPVETYVATDPIAPIAVEAHVQSSTSSVEENSTPAEPAPVASNRIVNVALSGGQGVVDMGAGPVLFPLVGFPPYVVEHDYAGGWARFGDLAPGMSVTMTGLVTGDYTVGEILNVAKGATTDSLTFSSTPRLMLQTCVPGTSRMIVIGLY